MVLIGRAFLRNLPFKNPASNRVKMEKLSNESSNLYSISFVVITGCNENGNMMLVIKLVVVFIVNFAMDKIMFMDMNE